MCRNIQKSSMAQATVRDMNVQLLKQISAIDIPRQKIKTEHPLQQYPSRRQHVQPNQHASEFIWRQPYRVVVILRRNPRREKAFAVVVAMCSLNATLLSTTTPKSFTEVSRSSWILFLLCTLDDIIYISINSSLQGQEISKFYRQEYQAVINVSSGFC